MLGNILVSQITPNPEQPRRVFDQSELQALAESMRERSCLQPILVERAGEKYILHDGERRWRAAQLAGITELPATILAEATDPKTKLLNALAANLVRSDLNLIEEGLGFRRMVVEFGMSHRAIGLQVGRKTSYIERGLLLITLPQAIQELIAAHEFTPDIRVARLLNELPEKTAVDAAKIASERKTPLIPLITALTRMKAQIAQTPKAASPVKLDYGMQFAGVTEPDVERWDALAQAGELPPWGLVVDQARATCRACSLHDQSSREVCGDCPAPQLIARIVGASRGR